MQVFSFPSFGNGCSAKGAHPYHSDGPPLLWLHRGVETWQGTTLRMGFGRGPLALTSACWGPGNNQQFRTERNCRRLEGCTGTGEQCLSPISSCTKIEMLSGNLRRTIARTGPYPVIFIQLLFIFPGQNSHRLHSHFAPCDRRLWHCQQEVGSGPRQHSRRDPPVKTGDVAKV